MKKRKSDDTLIRMANQIATYFDSQKRQDARIGTADHINGSWTPNMRMRLIKMIEAGDAHIGSTVVAAEALIRRPSERPTHEEGGL